MRKLELITAERLVDKGACGQQVKTFREEWPKGARVILKDLKRALELDLDIEWFAERFLAAQAWEAYEKAMAPAVEAYEKAMAPAREAYKKARAQAWEAYEKAMAPAREAYEKAMAQALYKAWRLQ